MLPSTFLVYPGADGQPEDSIRGEVFFEALQDQRMLQLLELKFGRDKLCAMLDGYAASGCLSMRDFPASEEKFLELREKIIRFLEE